MCQGLRLRVAAPQDAPALLALYAPYVQHTAITFETQVPTPGEFAQRMRQVQARYPYLVAETAAGDIAGYAYAGPFHPRAAYAWAAETTIYLRRDLRGRGIGGRLYGALEQALRAQGVLNLNACIAYPEPEDEYLTRGSVAFHQKQGFRLVGQFHSCGYKFGRWYHMVWMEKLIGPHPPHPPAVQPFARVWPGAAPFPQESETV